jgi:hypothetical protein
MPSENDTEIENIDVISNDLEDTNDTNVEPENNEKASDTENISDGTSSNNETEIENIDVMLTDSEITNYTQVVDGKTEEEKEKERQLSILEKKGKLEKPKQNAVKKTDVKKQTGRKSIRKTNSKSKK